MDIIPTLPAMQHALAQAIPYHFKHLIEEWFYKRLQGLEDEALLSLTTAKQILNHYQQYSSNDIGQAADKWLQQCELVISIHFEQRRFIRLKLSDYQKDLDQFYHTIRTYKAYGWRETLLTHQNGDIIQTLQLEGE
ncbi:hypothetical protein [Candidatus Albibeggiatoa sp. nov. NOAA]|uniref:hypothetical protein n=1 Tax=Candidatus Albibeggiatoa sp. nov. NOAA TaxID=3162724 RepID=UPI0032F4E380|nr:hypothetical protein [Thiotrichaceae bacterium]